MATIKQEEEEIDASEPQEEEIQDGIKKYHTIHPLNLMFPIPDHLLGPYSSEETSFGILGPRRSCKSDLLFQAAVRILRQYPGPNHTVLMLMPRYVKYAPYHIHEMDRVNSETARQILIQYFYSAEHMLEYLAQYYVNEHLPLAIMVDDLDRFSSKNVVKNHYVDPRIISSKILTLLTDMSHYCSDKNQLPCYVIVTGRDDPRKDPGNVTRLMHVFLDNIYTIERVCPVKNEDGTAEISTRDRKQFKMKTAAGQNIYYFIDDDVSRREIFLDRVTQVRRAPRNHGSPLPAIDMKQE